MASSDEPSGSGLFGRWLSWVAVATAGFTFFKIAPDLSTTKPVTSQTSTEVKPSQKDNATPVVTTGFARFPSMTWDDPKDQLLKAKEILSEPKEHNRGKAVSVISPDDLGAFRDILVHRIFDKSAAEQKNAMPAGDSCRFLLVVNLLSGEDTPEEKEGRIRSRHAQELALASMKFHPLLAERLSYLTFRDVSSSFIKGQEVKSVQEVPATLYEGDGFKEPRLILTLWVDQEILGVNPWSCLNSMLENFLGGVEVEGKREDSAFEKSVVPHSRLLIIGPTSSDILKKMRPYSWDKESDKVFLKADPNDATTSVEGFRHWQHISMISPLCTVPIIGLWDESLNAKQHDNQCVEIEYLPTIANDEELIKSLADELNLRLRSLIDIRRQIVLFVEQDRVFGRTLAKLLSNDLKNFDIIVVPYLRGVGIGDGKENDLGESNRVQDYFQRTINLASQSDDSGKKRAIYKPAAIGFLGGTWTDRMALLQQVRQRYPQSLCFTTDYDARISAEKAIPYTRNLLVASHALPYSKEIASSEEFGSIAFRDEYQTIWFETLCLLVDDTFSNRTATAEPSVEDVAILEQGSDQILTMPKIRTFNDNPLLFSLYGMYAVFVLFVLFSFPLFEWYYDKHYRKRKPKEELEELVLAHRLVSYEYGSSAIRWVFESFKNNLPASLASVCILIICIVPLHPEYQGWSTILTMSGVSVTSSVAILALCIPWVYRFGTQYKPGYKRISDLEKMIELSGTNSDEKPSVFGLAAGIVVTVFGLLVCVYLDDSWLLQVGVLSVISFLCTHGASTKLALKISLAIAVGLGVLKLVAADYAIVPSRDRAIRLIGDACFCVAYWWLIVSLIKLIILQLRIRRVLRYARIYLERATLPDEKGRFHPLPWTNDPVNMFLEFGDRTRRISQNLNLLAIVGLFICLARMPFFDAWGMSYATWFTIVLPMLAPLFFAVDLRHRSWEFREATVRYLRRQEFEDSANAVSEAKLQFIKDYDVGAFAPLNRDPLISSTLAVLLTFFSGPSGDLLRRISSLLLI